MGTEIWKVQLFPDGIDLYTNCTHESWASHKSSPSEPIPSNLLILRQPCRNQIGYEKPRTKRPHLQDHFELRIRNEYKRLALFRYSVEKVFFRRCMKNRFSFTSFLQRWEQRTTVFEFKYFKRTSASIYNWIIQLIISVFTCISKRSGNRWKSLLLFNTLWRSDFPSRFKFNVPTFPVLFSFFFFQPEKAFVANSFNKWPARSKLAWAQCES